MLIPVLLALVLTGGDVKDGAPIPQRYAWNKDGCTGKNMQPDVGWSGVPRGTKSLALTVVDYDAPKPGGWVHLLVLGMRPTSLGLRHRAQPAVDARNDFGELGWGGPCPPPGQLHHYTFTLDALDVAPAFAFHTTLAEYRERTRGHVIASARMVPVYKR